VFVSYALVSLTDAVLYTNPEKVTPAVAEHLKAGGVVVRAYDQLVADVKAKAAAKARIAMDMSKVRKVTEKSCSVCWVAALLYVPVVTVAWCIRLSVVCLLLCSSGRALEG
jgi:cytochrome c5